METWKEIKDFPKYFVSDLGGIISYKQLKEGKEITPEDRNGYLRVYIWNKYGERKHKTIHQLVLETFKPNPNPRYYNQVDHINLNKYDNRLSNLRWSNNSLNQHNKFETRGFYFSKKKRMWASQITWKKNKRHLGWYKTSYGARKRYLQVKRSLLKNEIPSYIV